MKWNEKKGCNVISMLLVCEWVGFCWIFVLSDVLLIKNFFFGIKVNFNFLIKCFIDFCDYVCD